MRQIIKFFDNVRVLNGPNLCLEIYAEYAFKGSLDSCKKMQEGGSCYGN